MPPFLIGALILLIVFAWLVLGEEKSIGEKVTVLLIFLGIYLGYRLMNGASVQEALIDPIVNFFKRRP